MKYFYLPRLVLYWTSIKRIFHSGNKTQPALLVKFEHVSSQGTDQARRRCEPVSLQRIRRWVTEAASEKYIDSNFYLHWDLEREGNGTQDETDQFLSLTEFESPGHGLNKPVSVMLIKSFLKFQPKAFPLSFSLISPTAYLTHFYV